MTLPQSQSAPTSVRLFYSYSHKDETYRDELEEHLSLLKRQGLIHSWHDRRIGAGQDWQGAIDENLEAANVILFLISAAFLASDYCYDREMRRALEKQENSEVRVIPVIIRPVDWSGAPFSKLQALPKDAKPVTSWPNRDEAWTDVAKGVRKAIEQLTACTFKKQKTEVQGRAEVEQKAGGESERLERKNARPGEAGRGLPEKVLAKWVSSSTSHILKGHTKGVHAVAFSPDGSILASGSGGFLFRGDCSIKLWTVSNGKLLRTLEGHKNPVTYLAFSPDGSTLVSSSGDKVWQWRVSDGARLSTFEHVPEGRIALSPDGAVLASVRVSGAELWRASDGGHLRTLDSSGLKSDFFPAIAFSPDGADLAAAAEGNVFLWRVKSGKLLRAFKISPEKNLVPSIAFSDDGKILAVAAYGVQLWRVSDGKLLRSLESRDSVALDTTAIVTFSPDGEITGAGYADKTVRLWRVSDGKLLRTLRGHSKGVNSMAFSPDGAMVASGSDDQTVRLWSGV